MGSSVHLYQTGHKSYSLTLVLQIFPTFSSSIGFRVKPYWTHHFINSSISAKRTENPFPTATDTTISSPAGHVPFFAGYSRGSLSQGDRFVCPCLYEGDEIRISGAVVASKSYDMVLDWRTAKQAFEIIEILKAAAESALDDAKKRAVTTHIWRHRKILISIDRRLTRTLQPTLRRISNQHLCQARDQGCHMPILACIFQSPHLSLES